MAKVEANSGMTRTRMSSIAAATRFVIAFVLLLASPAILPRFGPYIWLLLAYLGFAGVFQVMIWKEIGGYARVLAGGIVDMMVITFIVHRIGSVTMMPVVIYFFASLVNTLVTGRALGMIVAAIGTGMYDSLLIAELYGHLPYAPDAPTWAMGEPTAPGFFSAGLMVSVTMLLGTALVGAVVNENRVRERELMLANRKLKELSQRDPLTQLYNRRYVMERLENELARVRRGKPLAVIMVDLDRFKRINDDTGHVRGDALLMEMARALVRSVREIDVVGRYGGDEFVLVLPDTGPAAAEVAAARVVENIRELGVRFDPERPVTASVGLANARSEDEADTLLTRADSASYAAKAGGGNRMIRESGMPTGKSGRPVEQRA